MIQSYKKKFKTEENYDTIVIGSGIGGLTTAAFLAKEGKKVLVLERHYTAGGFTHILKEKDMSGMWEFTISGRFSVPTAPSEKCLTTLLTEISTGQIWEGYMIASSLVKKNMSLSKE